MLLLFTDCRFISCRKPSLWQLFRGFSLSVVCLECVVIQNRRLPETRRDSHQQLLPGGQHCDRMNHRKFLFLDSGLHPLGPKITSSKGSQLMMTCARLAEEFKYPKGSLTFWEVNIPCLLPGVSRKLHTVQHPDHGSLGLDSLAVTFLLYSHSDIFWKCF